MLKLNKDDSKWYEQSWFIMLLLFTPLFIIGLILLWRSTANKYMKIGFTFLYGYAIYYTIVVQGVKFPL